MFKTRGESWIEVTDAKGVVVVRKIITPGETVGASGTLPLAVVIGRADATAHVLGTGEPRTVKAVELSGVAGLLFRRNSLTGAVEVLQRDGTGVTLNTALHA